MKTIDIDIEGAVKKAEVVLNQLLKHTYLKTTFGIINVVLVNGSPHVLNLKELLHYYVQHRKDVTIRRINYELEKARARAHVLLGLLVALRFGEFGRAESLAVRSA